MDTTGGTNTWNWVSHYQVTFLVQQKTSGLRSTVLLDNCEILFPLQAFTDYTQWFELTESKGCPVVNGTLTCEGTEGLLTQALLEYSWSAGDSGDSTEVGYVCLSDCKVGYDWYPEIQRCLKVSSEPTNLGRAMVECGKDGSNLVSFYLAIS